MEKHCEYCSDIFVSGHGLQKYCSNKYEVSEYCKKQARKIKQPNVQRGVFDPILMQPLQFRIQMKHNEQILIKHIDSLKVKTVDLLEAGFNVHVYERSKLTNSKLMFKVGSFEYSIGRNSYCEIYKLNQIKTNKVQSKPSNNYVVESLNKINEDLFAFMKANRSV